MDRSMNIETSPRIKIDNLDRLRELCAHWVDAYTMLLPPEKGIGGRISLVFTRSKVELFNKHELPAQRREIALVHTPEAFTPELKQKYPHLSHYNAFRIDTVAKCDLRMGLRSIHFLLFQNQDGEIFDICGIQIPGAVDDLISYSGALGAQVSADSVTLRLWAPLAWQVRVGLFESPNDPEPIGIYTADYDKKQGVWEVSGPSDWAGCYYLFEVENYYPLYGRVSREWVTDPYSNGLSKNSLRSLIANLEDPSLMPAGWKELTKPDLDAFTDMAIYELHVRDFSAADISVPTQHQGTFLAFTHLKSNGMRHLKALSQAGITHLQLMPVFDFATVDEERSSWLIPSSQELAKLEPNSNQQAELVSKTLGINGYNWGYDPLHYNVPEGSYASEADGSARVLEFRQMVMALNSIGLRVVMDVVFNHVFSDGLEAKSVLDKVIPGYYLRLDFQGKSERSTCCPNIASEHRMAAKLMIDSLLLWAIHYKIDGFRFDLMGHIMLKDMLAARDALRNLTLEQDGVDGSKIALYGEGWDFGEVSNNTRGINASIRNLSGSGIGAFNDRLRDALRGGSAFGSLFDQGFATGLFSQPNQNESRDHENLRWRLMEHCDLIKVGLAGSIRNFTFPRAGGEYLRTDQIWYNGQLAGFAENPEENILYASAHDNETLWDIIQIKTAPYLSTNDRVRMNNLALAVVALGQGIPFFHAGDDLLRSKSLDRNSYHAGDWYNKIDWSMESNNWGVGLPLQGKEHWHYFSQLLGDHRRNVSNKEIEFAAAAFRMILGIRKSSPLFRLKSADEVLRTVYFDNNGPSQIPGLIVYGLRDNLGLDPVFEQVVTLFNSNPGGVYFGEDEYLGKDFILHPLQTAFPDEVLNQATFNKDLGEFFIPARSAAVFVLMK